jgi:hypothetical protein
MLRAFAAMHFSFEFGAHVSLCSFVSSFVSFVDRLPQAGFEPALAGI